MTLSASNGSAPQPGGTLTLLVDPEPTTLVALLNCGDPSMAVSAKVTEGLLTYDFDMQPQPQLSVSWEISADFCSFTFLLRRDVTWHDGADFTAADAAFSIALLKQVHPRGRVTFANLVEAAAADRYRLLLRFSRPAPYLIYALAGCESPILPRHRYDDSAAGSSPNNDAPIGTGPFLFREWIRGSHILYERNPLYWDRARPLVDRLLLRFIPEASERLAAIENGAVDVAPSTPVPVAALARLQSHAELRFETNGYQYTNQLVRLEFNLDHPQLRQLAVRQAIAHAIDRQTILDRAWLGWGEVAYGPISPELKRFAAARAPAQPFDPGEAERKLDAAGLPRGPDGTRLRLTLDYVPAGEGYRDTAEAVAQALGAIGLVVAVRTQAFPAYIRRLYTDRAFDFAIGRANNMFDPTIGMQRLYWSKNFIAGVPFSNGSHYTSPVADQLLEAAAVEPDPQERARYFARFQELVMRDLPDITLLAPRQITIHRRTVCGHTVTADGTNGNLAGAYRMSEPGRD